MQGLMAGDTGSESAPGYSGPRTVWSQVQGYQQPPYALPSPGHTVLSGLDPPTFAEGGPHSCTGLSNSQGPCGYCIHQDLADADWDAAWVLCFLCMFSLPVMMLSCHFHSHFLNHIQGNLDGCNSPWVLLQFLQW